MISLPEGISPDDIGQWLYGGVCVVVRPGTEPIPAMVDRVLDRTTVRAKLSTTDFLANESVPLSCVYAHWPMCGSINLPQSRIATHCERIPAKQYKRTFNSRQVQYVLPRAWDVRKMFGSRISNAAMTSSAEVIGALFKPWYPENFEAALELLGSGWLSVAVNPRIIIAGDDVGKRMIYYRGQLAATINGDAACPVADELTCKLVDRATGGRYTWIEA